MRVFEIAFQFHAFNEKENILSENNVFGKKSCFYTKKSLISGIFKKCMLLA